MTRLHTRENIRQRNAQENKHVMRRKQGLPNDAGVCEEALAWIRQRINEGHTRKHTLMVDGIPNT